jgi:hypothetical protein
MLLVVGMLVTMRMRLSGARTDSTRRALGRGLAGARNARLPDGRYIAFEDYRDETLRRVDREHREFQEVVGHLRMVHR